MTDRLTIYSGFVNDLIQKDKIRAHKFETRVSNLTDSQVTMKCGNWLRLEVVVDGITPTISRVLLVNPAITMQALNNQVLCPVLGWKNYHHCYAFRRCGMQFSFDSEHKDNGSAREGGKELAMKFAEKEIWIGPKRSNVSS